MRLEIEVDLLQAVGRDEGAGDADEDSSLPVGTTPAGVTAFWSASLQHLIAFSPSPASFGCRNRR